jgi:RNA polymerase sigma-70 factor (ECF subfamily)
VSQSTAQRVAAALSKPRPLHNGLHGLADEDLMALVHGGDAHAFEIIHDRHADAAFSLAYRMCGRRATAEDIVQDTFLSLWRRGARYNSTRGSVRSWLLGVVHNRAIDVFRRESSRTTRNISDDAAINDLVAPEDIAAHVQRRDTASQVRDAVSGLPPDQRTVIELAFFAGLTHTEIADSLHIPTGTVKGRMRRARPGRGMTGPRDD